MTTAELKSDLHKFIVEINDVSVLTQMREYLKNAVKSQTADWYNELSIEQIESINKGLTDLENGNTHKDEDVRKSIHQRILNSQK